MTQPPPWLQLLVGRYDPSRFEAPAREMRLRLLTPDGSGWGVAVADGEAKLRRRDERPDAILTGDEPTWRSIAEGARSGLDAYLGGQLAVRKNLHAGVGFLASTTGSTDASPMRFRYVATRKGRLSIVEAGHGPPVLAIHGLGATKGSFLPTVAALSNRFRVIALDLPGFGDSHKPISAAYDPRFFASACADLLDALGLGRVGLIGNSLGGRVALELALSQPDRIERLALLAPSLAWRRLRPFVPLVRLTRPELGLVQLAPRAVVDGVVRRLIPGADHGWVAAGVDEFLRAYLTPSGRAAFYAAARHIYLDEPHGQTGFWPRLKTLEPDALFIWGRRDRLVPIGFERHVTAALPGARHVELDCGHVPQIESPGRTHRALERFFSPEPVARAAASPTTLTAPKRAAA